ncbi:hypothetical protein TRAPUB_7561 [Trametes pubescens]|uniref:Uncharacterized protein n=1 Tax=Trametes pubescens TaxID=154538 RepID=A0A1M2V3A2_TRAPU|nr:hypothetical protein TRAPUB_7561 [Trametes pubescens]
MPAADSPEPTTHPATEPEDSATPIAVHPLTAAQERKLVDYLEDRFLDVTRNSKKRSDPTSPLTTLQAYLEATHHLLSLVLQIPPVDPSAPLRTTLLLRLSGEVLHSILGYTPDTDTLPLLLEWLGDLDQAWLAVLRAQAWDPEECKGVDVALPEGARATPMSQTERTRLRSLLISGGDGLEEWLEGLDTRGEESVEVTLERLGLEQAFNELFGGTLAEMGSLGGSEVNDPRGMIRTC